ncbi:unnamed protein product [Ambrosiozyma monospora]|uniref:Unnamed protein product n=1 Tax=Ambrosiozyma monospora TaxID=43982 RepID=A0ACB5UBQ4_AMBMO|nr:unnamed protein product [Ambrosiozyma monospora]
MTLIDDSAIKYSKLARDQAGIHYGKARTLAAPHLSKLDAKFAPVTKFIRSKVPVRTAGSTVGQSAPAPAKAPAAAAAPVSTGASTGVAPSAAPSAPTSRPAAAAAPSSSNPFTAPKSNAPIGNPLAD